MGEIFKFFINLARSLNPRVSDDPDQVFAWRQTVAVILILLMGMNGFTLVREQGWLDWMGVEPHLTETQFKDTQQLVRQTRQDQLVQQILDNTRRYCLAYEVGDQPGMTFAFQALQENRYAYFQLTQRDYPQLMCSMSAQPAKPTQSSATNTGR